LDRADPTGNCQTGGGDGDTNCPLQNPETFQAALQSVTVAGTAAAASTQSVTVTGTRASAGIETTLTPELPLVRWVDLAVAAITTTAEIAPTVLILAPSTTADHDMDECGYEGCHDDQLENLAPDNDDSNTMEYNPHKKGKRPSTWNKHTKPRPGRASEKKRQQKGWTRNPNKRKD